MTRFYFSKLSALIAILFCCNAAIAQTPITVSYTGTPYMYSVPSGVFSLTVDAKGADGGNGANGNAIGGGRVQCTIPTIPGSIYYFVVGQKGTNYSGSGQVNGGFNGGGKGYGYGAGGGGASDIRTDVANLNSRIVVSGGGGGGSSNCSSQFGGAGGGLTGGNGIACGSPDGKGGTQNAGGAGGTYSSSGSAGTQGLGGNSYSSCCNGGGGGGGYYGGGGGSAYGAGGGGSSYTDAALVTGVTHTPAFNVGLDGSITFTPNCTPPSPGIVNGTSSICIGTATPYSTSISAGGVWTSSNTSVATVDQTGLVTSVSVGTAAISYGVSYSCGIANNGKVITINPLPAPVTGSIHACYNQPTSLSDITPGGTWTSLNVAVATIGLNTGVVKGVSLGTTTVTYKVTATGCYSTYTQTVNALPAIQTVSVEGTGEYCTGGTGVRILMNQSEIDVNYSIVNNGNPIAGEYPGYGVPNFSFGLQTLLGTNTIVARNTINNCTSVMAGKAIIKVNALPNQYSVLAAGTPVAGHYCAGGTGVHISLSNSENNDLVYRLYLGGNPVGDSALGINGIIDFGAQTAGTPYTILAKNRITGCTNNMSNSITVVADPLPSVFSVTAGGAYCLGTAGVHDSLSGSVIKTKYELQLNGSGTGNIMYGTGSALDFGITNVDGTYTVLATDTASKCSVAMSGSTINVSSPLPVQNHVTSTGNYCPLTAGSKITLDHGDGGIMYVLYNGATRIDSLMGSGSDIDFGSHLAGNYTVVGTNTSTKCSSTMLGTINDIQSALPLPSVVSATAAGFCASDTGIHVNLVASQVGVNYQLSVNGTDLGVAVPGNGAGIDFGLQTASGTYKVIANSPSTTCSNEMSNTVAVVLNLPPVADTVDVTQNGSYCIGGTGVHVKLKRSESSGTSYQLYLDGALLSDINANKTGTNGVVDFGARTATGLYTVIGTNNSTTCKANMSGNALVSVNPLPTAATVTGGGAHCLGINANNVILSFSEPGVSYQLYNGVSAVNGSVAGTGGAIDFGIPPSDGTYTIQAINNSTTCSNTMSGSSTIFTTPLPFAYSVTGGGDYCSGSTGNHIINSASNTGINYQLYNGSLPMGGIVHGTGYALDFGLQTVSGTYFVLATNAVTGCERYMKNTIDVTPIAPPVEFSVTGGGNYCAGGTGINVGLDSSEAGKTYQLWNGSAMVGTAVAGTGNALSFGLKTTAGNYTVVASANGCSTTQSGSALLVAQSLPVKYTVSGGGIFCSGAAGTHVLLSASEAGVNYELHNSGGSVASLPGTGIGLDFGEISVAGTYSVIAVNSATSCSNNMLSSAVVSINAAPIAYTVIGGGSFCKGGTGVSIDLDHSDVGFRYQLYRGTTAIGSPAWGVGDTLDLGVHSTAGTYTVKAINTGTGCTNDMLSEATVVVNPVVTPAVSVTSFFGAAVCAGTVDSFIANPVNGGSAPSYEWHAISFGKDSVIGSGTDYFNYVPTTTGEVIKVIMTGNALCAVKPATSGSVIMTVNPVGKPAVTVASTPGLSVCPGTIVTLSAVAPAFGGTAPAYQWKKGSANIAGATNSTYKYVPANNDNVSVTMTSDDDACLAAPLTDTAATSSVLLTVQTLAAPVFTVQSTRASSGGLVSGQVDTLKAVITANGGSAPAYQWVVNNTPLAGETKSMLITNNLFNKDSVSCIVTASGDCGEISASKSIIIDMHGLSVNPLSASANDIRLVPNPNNGLFTVRGTFGASVNEEVSLQITNMLGQVVYQDKVMVSSGKIDTKVQLGNNLANGMYILNLRAATENTVLHFEITK